MSLNALDTVTQIETLLAQLRAQLTPTTSVFQYTVTSDRAIMGEAATACPWPGRVRVHRPGIRLEDPSRDGCGKRGKLARAVQFESSGMERRQQVILRHGEWRERPSLRVRPCRDEGHAYRNSVFTGRTRVQPRQPRCAALYGRRSA